MPALLELVGDCSGLNVCDLACGTGIAAQELAARGARVTGIDLSERLLGIARAEALRRSLTIEFIHADICSLSNISGAAFDGAVCSLALMDIENLDACLGEVARIVRPGGWFVFTITHPCFQTPESRWTGKSGGTVKREVRGYFREGFWRSDNAGGVRGQVGAYHRTLSKYFNAMFRTGFSFECVVEPRPTDETASRVPGYAEVPVVLAAKCGIVRNSVSHRGDSKDAKPVSWDESISRVT